MVSNFKTDASLVDVVNEKDGMPTSILNRESNSTSL